MAGSCSPVAVWFSILFRATWMLPRILPTWLQVGIQPLPGLTRQQERKHPPVRRLQVLPQRVWVTYNLLRSAAVPIHLLLRQPQKQSAMVAVQHFQLFPAISTAPIPGNGMPGVAAVRRWEAGHLSLFLHQSLPPITCAAKEAALLPGAVRPR